MHAHVHTILWDALYLKDLEGSNQNTVKDIYTFSVLNFNFQCDRVMYFCHHECIRYIAIYIQTHFFLEGM